MLVIGPLSCYHHVRLIVIEPTVVRLLAITQSKLIVEIWMANRRPMYMDVQFSPMNFPLGYRTIAQPTATCTEEGTIHVGRYCGWKATIWYTAQRLP